MTFLVILGACVFGAIFLFGLDFLSDLLLDTFNNDRNP